MLSLSVPGLRFRHRRCFAILASLTVLALLSPPVFAADPEPGTPAAKATEDAAPADKAIDAAPADKAAPAAATEAAPAGAPANSAPPMPITYLGKRYPEPLPLSYAEKPITDKGIQGARLGLKEINQAGNFVGNSFELKEAILPADGDIVAKAKEIFKDGPTFIIADLESADLLAVADLPEAKNSVIMNIRSSATALRQEQCRINVFHVIPDYAMRADALAQYLIWKKRPSVSLARHNPYLAGCRAASRTSAAISSRSDIARVHQRASHSPG